MDCAKIPGFDTRDCCDICHEDWEEYGTEGFEANESHVCCQAHTQWERNLLAPAEDDN